MHTHTCIHTHTHACVCAGLEVGDHLRSREEIRKEWEEFKARLEKQKQVRLPIHHTREASFAFWEVGL